MRSGLIFFENLNRVNSPALWMAMLVRGSPKNSFALVGMTCVVVMKTVELTQKPHPDPNFVTLLHKVGGASKLIFSL